MNAFGQGAAAILLLTVALLLMWKRKAPKLTTVLMIGAGAGIGGLIGQWIDVGASWVTSLLAMVLGGAAGAVISVVLAFIVGHDMWRGHAANRLTIASGFLLPVFVVGGGLLGQIVNGIANLVNRFGSVLAGGLF